MVCSGVAEREALRDVHSSVGQEEGAGGSASVIRGWMALLGLLAAGCMNGQGPAPADARRKAATTIPADEQVPRERLDAAARAQVGAERGATSGLHRAYEDLVPDLWTLSVEAPERLYVAILRVSGGRVTVPAGLDQAGRELAEMGVLSVPDWKGSSIHVVSAAGGWPPGWPDVPIVEEERLFFGGMRLAVRTPVSWVRYAAAGGVGPPPETSSAPDRGLAAPEEVGTLKLEISSDYDLRWTFEAAGRDLGSCEASRARRAPALSDADLLTVLDVARRRARAPRAMPLTEPRAMTGYPGLVTVPFCMLGDVHVDLASRDAESDFGRALARLGALGVDLGAPPPPATLLPILEAVGGLPPGLLASDLSSPRIVSGELVADVTGPLTVWSRSGARSTTPRSPHLTPDVVPPARGRARLRLDRSAIAWTLEDVR